MAIQFTRGTIIGRVKCGWITNTILADWEFGSNSCELLRQKNCFHCLDSDSAMVEAILFDTSDMEASLGKMSAARNKWALTSSVLSTAKMIVKMEGEVTEIVTNQICCCTQYRCSSRERQPSEGCEHRLCLWLWWRCWCSPLLRASQDNLSRSLREACSKLCGCFLIWGLVCGEILDMERGWRAEDYAAKVEGKEIDRTGLVQAVYKWSGKLCPTRLWLCGKQLSSAHDQYRQLRSCVEYMSHGREGPRTDGQRYNCVNQ